MTVRRRTTGKYRSSSSLFGALLRRAAFPESKEGKHACFSLPTQYLSDPGPSGLHRELGGFIGGSGPPRSSGLGSPLPTPRVKCLTDQKSDSRVDNSSTTKPQHTACDWYSASSASDSASGGLRAIDCTACWRLGRRKRRRGRPSARTECL